MPRILSLDALVSVDTFDALLAEVERISLLPPFGHDRYDRDRRDKPKPKSGAASAAPDGGKGKSSGGNARAGNSGKGGSGKPSKPRDGSGKPKPSVSAAAADGITDREFASHFDEINTSAYSVSLPQLSLSKQNCS